MATREGHTGIDRKPPPRPIKMGSVSDRTRLTPGLTIKKLPWLEGKAPSAVSYTTSTREPTTTPSSVRSPTSRISERSQAVDSQICFPKTAPKLFLNANPAIRAIGSTPTLRRSSLKRPGERKVSSIGASSPSPITKKRISQAPIIGRRPASPLREEASSTEQGLLSNDTTYRVGVRFSRNHSIAPIDGSGDHTDGGLVQRVTSFASSRPKIVRSHQISPKAPIPSRRSIGNPRSRRLSSAIEGLEEMVKEAVHIAEDAPDRDQVEEVYEIIEDATKALHEASALPVRGLIETVSPLVVSSSSEEVSEFSSLPSDPPRHLHTHDGSIMTTPPQLYTEAPRSSIAIDWAEKKRHKQHSDPLTSSKSSSSSSRSASRTRSPFSSHSDLERLLPPEPVQATTREHFDLVVRPSANSEYSRGRSRRRRSSDDNERKRHRHHGHRRSNDGTPKPRHHHHLSSDHSDVDPTYDPGLSVREQMGHHTFNLHRRHRRQPIARNWSSGKKRVTAIIACINTGLLGLIVGIYAGEVPRIQYILADERHIVIVGNVVLYAGLAISTFFAWPLPLLHGRKPYILAALALALPLQFPQAIIVGEERSPKNAGFRTGLLVARMFTGLVFGFANVNFIATLLDLFGASLQSKNPHQEVVIINDARRHGGGMGLWLGIWSWCWIGSIAVGFQIGAGIIEHLPPSWGFYITVIILASALVLNVLAPETRRAAYRKSVTEVYDRDDNFITRRVARGEIKLHISTEGPHYWFEEVWAGMKLMFMMMCQTGFAVLAFYLGWIYAQIVLVIVLLGALLSRDYKWHPQYVGLGVISIAIGALLAVPLTKAGLFSRERKSPFRTDSMTFQKQVTWSSHLVRRVLFTLTLPLMGLAYTVSSAGRPKPHMVPIVFAGAVGFLSVLAIAECLGLIMETFDTCDLQPGTNTKHRLESMAVQDRRRRTNYSSFPRVSAGIYAAQTLAFIGAAVATEVGGIMTRHIGAQASTGVTAGILLALTILLTAVLWRWREIQVIPNHTFGTRRDTKAWEEFKEMGKSDWKAVVIGNPSGKFRRMSVLEMGGLSRWTEIRKLNFLVRDDNGNRSGTKGKWGWY